MKTLSIRYLVDAGRTSPATRFTTISRNPRTIIPRRGLSSASTSGRSFQACFPFAGFVCSILFSADIRSELGTAFEPFRRLTPLYLRILAPSKSDARRRRETHNSGGFPDGSRQRAHVVDIASGW